MILKDSEKLIVINAGHHLNDTGQVTAGGIRENDQVMFIRDAVVPLLKKNFTVIYIPDNLDLSQSCDMANLYLKGLNDGLAIDIHLNARFGTTRGTESYATGGKNDRIIAKTLTNHIAKKLGTMDRGWRHQSLSGPGSLMWVNKIKGYAQVLEACYLDNDSDRQLLMTGGHKKIAEGINDAMLELWDIKKPKLTKEEKAQIEVRIGYLEQLVGLLSKLLKIVSESKFVAKIGGKSRNS